MGTRKVAKSKKSDGSPVKKKVRKKSAKRRRKHAKVTKADRIARGNMVDREENAPGPDPTPIDYNLVKNLASLGCTQAEIGTAIGFTREWICKRQDQDPELRAAMEAGRESGRVTLRRLQWQGAQAGNPTMLIWLGKQLLGQKDKTETELNIVSHEDALDELD